MTNATVTLEPGSSIRIEFADSDGGFEIQFGHDEIIVRSDMPGNVIGAEGIIHHEVFSDADDGTKSAIEEPNDELNELAKGFGAEFEIAEQFVAGAHAIAKAALYHRPAQIMSGQMNAGFSHGRTSPKANPDAQKAEFVRGLAKPEERRIGKAPELGMGYGHNPEDPAAAPDGPLQDGAPTPGVGYGHAGENQTAGSKDSLTTNAPLRYEPNDGHECVYNIDTGKCFHCGADHGIKF